MREMKCAPYGRRIAGLLVLLFGGALYPGDVSPAPAGVEIQMRAVNLHLDRVAVLEIKQLRGQMVPTKPNSPVTFDDASSFVTHISTGDIAMSLATLSTLLNE